MIKYNLGDKVFVREHYGFQPGIIEEIVLNKEGCLYKVTGTHYNPYIREDNIFTDLTEVERILLEMENQRHQEELEHIKNFKFDW